jgi:hypothetical protein
MIIMMRMMMIRMVMMRIIMMRMMRMRFVMEDSAELQTQEVSTGRLRVPGERGGRNGK